jgi:hypothetical protein
MPMSPRTLRPRQTIHPEAASWAARVVANGGSASGLTLNAVDKFCKAVDAAGIRSIFYRVNLFCGGTSGTTVGINSCVVPLYRGQSATGTQFGNTIDNPNLFGVGDYATTGGLTGGGSKYLDTGLATNILTAGNRHISAYERVRSAAMFNTFLGSEAISGVKESFSIGYNGSATTVQFGYGAFSPNISAVTTSAAGLWLGVNTPANTGLLYRNGVQDATSTQTAATPEASNIFVFALNRASASAATNFYTGTLGGYSIGLAMTATQALAYYNAMQAFQSALNRSV